MTLKRRSAGFVLAASGLALACVPAAAQTGVPGDFDVSGNTGVWSKYRFRGVSLSGDDPAVQGSLVATHKSGLYAGAWASTLDGFGRLGGADAEIDLFGGYGGDFALGSYDIGIIWYAFPGAGGANRIELQGSVSAALGPAEAKVGASWAPSQGPTGEEDNLYLYTNLSSAIPATPVTLKAHLGYTRGGLAPDRPFSGDRNYLDWSLGADYALGPLTLGVAYVDTDVRSANPAITDFTDAAIVASVSVGF